MNSEWRSRYEAAVEATRKAGRLAAGYFDQNLAVEWKQDESPVTVADREAETLLRQTLEENFPEDGYLGEEHGNRPGTSGYRWIIDPIDGTRNFVRGIPVWGTLVGLEYRGETIAGVVDAPALGFTYRALRGDGAYRNDRPIHVSAVDRIEEATVLFTVLSSFDREGKRDGFYDLVLQAQVQRGYGDFYGHMLVAQGSADLMVEFGVHVWDVAAVKPIVEEAGGRFSDWSDVPTIERPDVLTSNGRLHAEALRILRRQV